MQPGRKQRKSMFAVSWPSPSRAFPLSLSKQMEGTVDRSSRYIALFSGVPFRYKQVKVLVHEIAISRFLRLFDGQSE